MSLISMVVYATETNHKDECFEKCLQSLMDTVDFTRNRLILSINGFTEKTMQIIDKYASIIETIIGNKENIGTAEAQNKVWRQRKYNEPVIKIDEDIVINTAGWIELMEEAISIDREIGIIGLKRKDLIQNPLHPDPQYRSELILLPHIPGHKWITIERTPDVIGSCTMFNPLLLDKVGYSRQPGKYGFEDNLFCHRSHLAGFYNCFLNYIDIDHIDPGGGEYQAFKEKHSCDLFPEYHRLVHDMINGRESIYYNPFKE